MKCLRINNEETSNTSRAITLKNLFQEKILKFGGYTLHISEKIFRVSSSPIMKTEELDYQIVDLVGPSNGIDRYYWFDSHAYVNICDVTLSLRGRLLKSQASRMQLLSNCMR